MPNRSSKFKHFSPKAMLEDLMDSPEVVCNVLTYFISWQNEVAKELRSAADPADNHRLLRVAHSLRGTLAQLHADTGAQLASALELTCKQAAPVPPSLPNDLHNELVAVANEASSYLRSSKQ
jgi:HPt (histidine-containing phosphotransfer) domain-containing protein